MKHKFVKELIGIYSQSLYTRLIGTLTLSARTVLMALFSRQPLPTPRLG